jgi:pimeloyl-ACP methyl ester carboxylesterase
MDNVCPPGCARLLAEHLPNATLCELEGLGHYHMATHWSELIGVAAGFEPDLDEMKPRDTAA